MSKDKEIERLELIEDRRDPSWFQYGKATLGDAAADEIERLQAKVERLTKRGFEDLNWENDELKEENERLRAIVDEVENLHHGTDLFTNCAAGAADRLIELIEKEVGDD